MKNIRPRSFFNEFKEFALRGSVIDLAVGIIIGGAFSAITKSLVEDVVMPPIGSVLGKVSFDNLYINLSTTRYDSLKAAEEAGAPVVKYGAFINSVIDFLILAFIIFLIVSWINNLKRKEEGVKSKQPTNKTCPYCFSTISVKAVKCPNCTSKLSK